MDCKTCELLHFLKDHHHKMNLKRDTLGIPYKRNNFTSAIIDRTLGGRLTYYGTGHGRRIPLNYCPECGRQIKKKRST